MKVLNSIVDTWNVLEKYDVKHNTINDDLIAIPDADFKRILEGSKNKDYILGLHNTSEFAKKYEKSHLNYDEAKKYLGEEFEKYVPNSGKSDSLYGESIRSIERIMYRNYNDGDMIGHGYGNETCNPAARFLSDNLPNPEISFLIDKMWEESDDSKLCEDQYEADLKQLVAKVGSYLSENKDVLVNKETDDMLTYSLPEDSKYYDDEDEDEDYYDDDEDEDDYCF